MSLMHRILKGLFLAVVGIVVLASPFIVLYFAFAGLRPGSTMSPEVLAAYVAEIVWAAAQVLSLFAIAFSAAVAISSHGAWTGAVQAVQRRPMDFGDYYSLLGVRRGLR